MKLASSLFAVLLGCSHNQPPPDRPAPATSTRGAEVPDLDLPTQQVDGLPITELIDPGGRERRPVTEAIAILHPTAEHRATGTVRFVEEKGQGIRMFAAVEGLPAGRHAMHVHLYGDCSAPDGQSAGPHMNFLGSSFDAGAGVITGNLGEVGDAGSNPSSTANRTIAHASLQGEFSIIGRAVVVHERGNDPAITPDGGAGARIACGVIGIAGPNAPRSARR